MILRIALMLFPNRLTLPVIFSDKGDETKTTLGPMLGVVGSADITCILCLFLKLNWL